MSWVPYLIFFTFIAVFLVLPQWLKMRRDSAKAQATLDKAIAAGRQEPVSIRPLVDPAKCVGTAACVAACPEKEVLQVVDGLAMIANGSSCVGHGACEASCPLDAIELVFGSERRGIDIPAIGPDFQTNINGLYVAGELGGIGLIANTVSQGVQAAANMCAKLPQRAAEAYDIAIVGAGPAGLGAALEAKRQGVRYLLLEQGEFGGAIRHYPRQKLVMTRPMDLPGYGRVQMSTARKEELVELFEKVVAETGLEVCTHERVDKVDKQGDHFVVTTNKRVVHATRVVLTVGRRGTPRKLGVPGEDQEKVAYRLLDPELYDHQQILVVGGGDSAVEAACCLAEQPGNRVTLSYRKASFSRPKAANQERLRKAEEDGVLQVMRSSNVKKIGLDRVVMAHEGEEQILPNDYVFVFAGGVLPTRFLQQAGIKIQTHYGKRVVEQD